MKNTTKILGIISLSVLLFSFTLKGDVETSKYKCLVQLTNYEGEGAYMSVAVADAEDQYVETLYVMGYDYDWYPELIDWWRFEEKKNTDIDAISGATVSGGGRKMFTLKIEDKYMNGGYKLRFETAVEDGEYHSKDVEIPLVNSNLNGKFEGMGYIRYVRLVDAK